MRLATSLTASTPRRSLNPRSSAASTTRTSVHTLILLELSLFSVPSGEAFFEQAAAAINQPVLSCARLSGAAPEPVAQGIAEFLERNAMAATT